MISDVFLETDVVERVISNFALEAQQRISAQLQRRKKKVLVLAGPTSSGKSRLAIELAQMMGGEVVSADSMQVYRGMDIGTAKVGLQERLLVPHHLIDIRDIQESFNVVDFYYEARRVCQEILDRGGVPIVTGGSGFYLHAFLYGPPSGPPSLPELRRKLERECEYLGAECLYDRLACSDPQYAKTITKHDKQKIVRALEIMALTREKVSQLAWRSRRGAQDYHFHCWFLYRPKEVLHRRIEERCDRMLEEGFLREVEQLEKEGIRSNASASQAIGYRQALDFLRTSRSPEDYLNFVGAFKRATRRYVKRQFTWFRKEPLFRWLDIDAHDPEVVFDLIKQDYEAAI